MKRKKTPAKFKPWGVVWRTNQRFAWGCSYQISPATYVQSSAALGTFTKAFELLIDLGIPRENIVVHDWE